MSSSTKSSHCSISNLSRFRHPLRLRVFNLVLPRWRLLSIRFSTGMSSSTKSSH
uniref:Uncharacterized protein n=1 Tax=Helianthus annuus TaxID=4232 RepID=A0A251V7H4_HELAN